MANDIKNKVIAVIGVSNKPEKFGYKIFKDLLAAGFKVCNAPH
jgi:predicted CoA-binding protein